MMHQSHQGVDQGNSTHSMPFSRIPKLLVIHIILESVKLLNFFPSEGGLLDTLSPKTIMSGKMLNYKKDFSTQIGQYCQVHKEEAPCNSQNSQTKGTIALSLSGNLQVVTSSWH
jgi:hypothetical protein